MDCPPSLLWRGGTGKVWQREACLSAVGKQPGERGDGTHLAPEKRGCRDGVDADRWGAPGRTFFWEVRWDHPLSASGDQGRQCRGAGRQGRPSRKQ